MTSTRNARSRSSPREAGVDLALEIIGGQRNDDPLDPRIDRAEAERTGPLQRELVDARETVAALKAELRRWCVEDTEVDRLLGRLGV